VNGRERGGEGRGEEMCGGTAMARDARSSQCGCDLSSSLRPRSFTRPKRRKRNMCHQFMIQWLLFFTDVDKDEPSVGNPTNGMFFADVDSLRIELGRLL
jgi:hypothetical protein